MNVLACEKAWWKTDCYFKPKQKLSLHGSSKDAKAWALGVGCLSSEIFVSTKKYPNPSTKWRNNNLNKPLKRKKKKTTKSHLSTNCWKPWRTQLSAILLVMLIHYLHKGFISKAIRGAGELSWWLSALAAAIEDLRFSS